MLIAFFFFISYQNYIYFIIVILIIFFRYKNIDGELGIVIEPEVLPEAGFPLNV